MSASQKYPNLKPSLLLDFANRKSLGRRVTFTRASEGRYYDGKTTAKAEENLLLQSEFASGWLNSGTNALTPNNSTAPNGATTAALLSSPATADYVYQVPVTTIGTQYVFSFFVKNSTATVSHYHVRTASTAAIGYLSWTGSTLTSATAGIGNAPSFVDVGGGWYRVSVVYTATETNARHRIGGGDVSTTTGNIFVWGTQLEQRTTITAYTPTTTQPITNYIPVLQTAPANTARFDHNPATGESLGLLIEEQRTNTYPNSFIVKSGGTGMIYSDGFPALNPEQFFVLGQENSANTEHFFTDMSLIPTLNTTYSFSVYAKQGPGNRLLQLRIAAGNVGSAFFDLTSGTGVSTGGVVSSLAIVPVGNGIYRCTAVWTATSATTTVVRIQLGQTIYQGDGYSGIYIWGAQLEAGAFPTSYIPTVASQVTRSADAAAVVGENFTSFFNPSEGTVYFETQSVQGLNAYPYSLFGTSTQNRIFVNYSTSLSILAGVRVNNVFEGLVTTSNSTSPTNTFGKGATAYKVNDFGFSWNGAAALTDTSTTLPIIVKLDIGSNGQLAGNWLNGHVRKLAYYSKRLSDTELQALTAS